MWERITQDIIDKENTLEQNLPARENAVWKNHSTCDWMKEHTRTKLTSCIDDVQNCGWFMISVKEVQCDERITHQMMDSESTLELNILAVLIMCELWVIHNFSRTSAVWQKIH